MNLFVFDIPVEQRFSCAILFFESMHRTLKIRIKNYKVYKWKQSEVRPLKLTAVIRHASLKKNNLLQYGCWDKANTQNAKRVSGPICRKTDPQHCKKPSLWKLKFSRFLWEGKQFRQNLRIFKGRTLASYSIIAILVIATFFPVTHFIFVCIEAFKKQQRPAAQRRKTRRITKHGL